MRPAFAVATLLLLACLTGCVPGPTGPTPAPVGPEPAPAASPPPLSQAAREWIDTTLAGMTLEQKAAQLVMVRASGTFENRRSAEARRVLSWVRELGVGGVVLFASEVETLPRWTNELQAAAALPLLVAADLERSLAFRIERGTVPLPYAMAVGATRSTEAARISGEITAREARALGLNWALAPVADVNSNPDNPVINIRSYGEDAELVAKMNAAFIAGARQGGVLTTAKHFPGHGDTATDSHLALPVLGANRERLDAVEWVPFRRAIAAGVDAVMLGHIAVPALDPAGTPATLSPALSGRLLREEMGFAGLIVTDALEMAGMRPAWTGEATVGAVLAGADVLLLPQDPRVAVQSLVRAVGEGKLSEARLEESVRRLLEAKARLGLFEGRLVDRTAAPSQVGRPEDLEQAAAIARAAVTVVKNEGGVLPLAAEGSLDLLHLVLSSDATDRGIRGLPEEELAARGIPVETRQLGPDFSTATVDEIVAAAAGRSHVLVSAFVRVASFKGTAAMRPRQAELLRRLAATGVPVIVVSFGSPYLLLQFPEVPVYLCAYGWAESSQRAAVAALFGETAVTGKLPVTLPGLFPYGHGLEIPRRAMTLTPAQPEEVGFRPGAMAEVDAVIERALAEHAFPGAVVAVGRRGKLVHLAAFGRQTYEPEAPAVTPDTIYDLASLTKVIATTTMAMMLVDEGRLSLDKRVVDFLPRFRGPGKEGIRVRDLLTHSSGLPGHAPLYLQASGREAILALIESVDLAYPLGSRSEYSDVGFVLLGEILERVAGRSLEGFVRERVLEPLGMRDTLYCPGPDLLPRIAPTEVDAWRGRLIHGEVHDENAFALGGVAAHAGLFGTAGDVARFAQMMLWNGVFDHRRLVSPATVAAFTRRSEVPSSSRALGWDTRSATGSSAGSLFSDRAYGHTGFTGTSLWIDPERELFLILLTNRVHPNRENLAIRQVRPALADAVVRGLEDFVPAPAVRVGLERLGEEGVPSLAGKRVGLVAHGASVTAAGRSALEVLRAHGAQVVRLFSPEHGLAGQAGAGEAVASGRDGATGLPVVSLYGEKRAPSAADLDGLDALVFDLQDAGVRFYTYASTLLLCLMATAEVDLELVVLDRPNPLGGERVEGPVSAPREVVPASFVNLAPGPLVHGLTLGELARHANALRPRPARLTVVPMSGWRRAMTWSQTGRPWVAPSPNLRSAEAALAYPGVALLEATNVSEGRGTASPFLLFGAPWLEPSGLALSVPGFGFQPLRFVPRTSPAAPAPKHRDRECRGFSVQVEAPAAAQPYRLGLALLAALSRQEGFEWREDGAALTRLLGTPKVLAALRAGTPVEEILAADEADHLAWREARRPALLYE
ncbi:MAG TPA: glycoside hydrolase family 3 N-terminal domain-containing protein [Thermoanaerobaculia bacterium]|nr:glycoside hydrolase family 3 N-terminal domain-containing protein [Thermoanaerobaculia bacterium]